MTGAVLLAFIAAGTVTGAHLLSRARWTWRTPRAGILLWQALGLAWGIATIGTLLGIAVHPYGRGVAGGLLLLAGDLLAGRPLGTALGTPLVAALAGGLTLAAVLLTMLMYAVVTVVRARRRHRALLALVAHGEPSVPGTLVLDHPAAAAYCVPGVRSAQVVVSAGTLQLLDRAELAAVLAHERAHARERHDLVLLPFASLRQIFPRFGLVTRSLDAVALLVEMAADDRARRHRPPRELATALLRFAAAGPAATPSGALAAIEVSDAALPYAPGSVSAQAALRRTGEAVPVPVAAAAGAPVAVAEAAEGAGAAEGAVAEAGAAETVEAGAEARTHAGPGTGMSAGSMIAAGTGPGADAGTIFGPYSAEPSPVIARVHRLIEPEPPQPAVRAAALLAAALFTVVPPLLYALPF